MTLATNSSTAVDPALTMARQALYRFAALSLLDPREGTWQELSGLRENSLLQDAALLIRSLPEVSTAELGFGEQPIELLEPQKVLAYLPESEQALNKLYENTFGLLVSSNCPPYEMEYVHSKFTFQRSNTLADITGYYHAFGLTVSDKLPERPDHIVLELEFMASLLGLQRQAASSESPSAAAQQQVCRDAQLSFLREHLAWWVPAFCMLLEKQSDGGFYTAASKFLAAFLAAERAVLGLPSASRPITPSLEERPEICEGCQLAG